MKSIKKSGLISFLLLGPVSTVFTQNLQWAKDLVSSNSFSMVNDISTDLNNNIYVSGTFNDTVDFDPGPGVNKVYGDFSTYVVKLDSAGNYVWARTFDTQSTSNYGGLVKVDATGNIYISSNFTGTVDFDPGAGVANLTSAWYDVFILKLNSNGNYVWAKNIDINTGIIRSLEVDPMGNVYPVGHFYGTVDFDPGPGVANLSTGGSSVNGFILKLDTTGNYVWAKPFLSDSGIVNYSASIDNSGNIYTIGRFLGSTDFDPGAGTYNLTDTSKPVFVCKLDNSGNFQWATSYKAYLNYEMLPSIHADAFGGVYTTGCFVGTVDFDPGVGVNNLTSNGSSDVYINKLDASGNFVWAKNFGGSSIDGAYGITTDNNGNVYSIGLVLSDTVDFNPGVTTFNLTSSFGAGYISALDASGNFLWAIQNQGSTGLAKGKIITIDQTNHICSAGQFIGTVDFDPGAGIFDMSNLFGSGIGEMYIQKLSTSTMGVENVYENPYIQIYPNPTTDIITIDFLTHTCNQPKVEVYNSLGQMVIRSLNQNGNKIILDFQYLVPGMYTVRVNILGVSNTWKVIKQ